MELLEAIKKRREFLKQHPRLQPGIFARDFINRHGYHRLVEIEAFDECGAIICDSVSLFGMAGNEAERKQLQRSLKALVDAGKLERIGRSTYRLT